MNTVHVRNITIGEGIPKICVPIVASSGDAILKEARRFAGLPADLVEWRLDWFDGRFDLDETRRLLAGLREALGDKRGIRRFGSACIPMDEALCRTVLDFSGRPFLVFEADMPQETVGSYDACLTEEFMRAVAVNGGITLHMKAIYGKNAHHITEALFKSLGVAMREALQIEGAGVTSTKGMLE